MSKIRASNEQDSGFESVGGNFYKHQILRTGKWCYPPGSDETFELTDDTLKEIVGNFTERIKYPVPITRPDHDEIEGVPKSLTDCGWNHGLFWVPGKLYSLMEITDSEIRKKVDERSLRYASSELDLAYVSPERKAAGDAKPRPVLEGVTLTNRPYLKGMDPIVKIFLCEEGRTAGNPGKDGSVPELTLTEAKAEIDALKKQLAEKPTAGAGDLKLAEEVRTLKGDLRLNDFITEVTRHVQRGKYTPAFGHRMIRFAEFMVRSNHTLITLSEPVQIRKVSLAEAKQTEPMDKLDVLREMTDMLGQLPDAMAQDQQPQLTEANGYPGSDVIPSDKKALNEMIVEKAKELRLADPKLDHAQSLSNAKKLLTEGK